MPVLRIMHLSDLHLGYSPGFLGDRATTRRKERDAILSKAVDAALAADVDMVIIAGDLFDCHNPPAALAEYALQELTRLAAAGVAIVTVPGNHDEISYSNSVYRVFDWPGVLVTNPLPAHVTSLRLKEQDLHIYSLAYTSGVTAADAPLKGLPRLPSDGIHVAVFHGSLDIYGGERSLPLSSHELAAVGYDYVALGHFHRFSEKRLGSTTIAYCGAPEARSLTDLGCGHVIVADLVPGKASITKVPLEVRPHRVVSLEVSDGLQQEIERLGNADLLLQIRLIGVSDLTVTADYLAEKFDHLFYYLEVVDHTDHLPMQLVEEWGNETSVRGLFVKGMQAKISEAGSGAEVRLIQRALIKGLKAFGGVRR